MERLSLKEKNYIDTIIAEYDRSMAECQKADSIQEIGLLFKRLFYDVDGFVCFGEKEGHCALVFKSIPADIQDKKAVAIACNRLEEAYIEIIQGLHFIMSLHDANLVVFKWELAPNDKLVTEDMGDASQYVHLAISDSQMESFIRDHHYASILPTPDLREFVKRGYVSADVKRHRQIMRSTWTGIIVAILIGIASILVNKCSCL